MSRWSPSPPRSKLRRQDFGSGWPIRYAHGFTAKTGRSLTPGFNYTSTFHNIIQNMVKKKLVFIRLLRFYKRLGNIMFPMKNIIQASCDNRKTAFQGTSDISSTCCQHVWESTPCFRFLHAFTYSAWMVWAANKSLDPTTDVRRASGHRGVNLTDAWPHFSRLGSKCWRRVCLIYCSPSCR